MFSEEEFLMISGIQHYFFCKRQWVLIHCENQWLDNVLTIRGSNMHQKVDDPFILESRGEHFISRSVPLASRELGIYGISDAVEFYKDIHGVQIVNHEGRYNLYPVEYKLGKPKKNQCDEVQLCAQAMCLEEMLNCEIPKGYLYYGKTRHRKEIDLDKQLRATTKNVIYSMRDLFELDSVVKATYSKKCDNCSLYNICLPKVRDKYKSVENYIKTFLRLEEGCD